MRTRYRRWVRLGVLAIATSGVAACRGDTIEPQVPDVTSAYWALTLDHHAIALSTDAPHHTIQLTAVPRSPAGVPLDGFPAPSYASGNSEVLQVSATGLVTALAPAFGVPVTARLTAGGITHVDTAFIDVVPGPAPTLGGLSIQPQPGDSAKFAPGLVLDQFRVLTPVALDALGNPMSVPVHFESSDPTVSGIGARSGLLAPVRRGAVTFTATTTAYGITRADTLPYTIGIILFGGVTVQAAPGATKTRFSPPTTTIGSGGIVVWDNLTGIPTDVTFDDPSAAGAVPEYFECANGMPCDAGDIPAFGTSEKELIEDPFGAPLKARRVRRFSTPGSYTYRSALFNTTGTIVVVAE